MVQLQKHKRSRSELWCLLLQTGQNFRSYLASNNLDVCWWLIWFFNTKVSLFGTSSDRLKILLIPATWPAVLQKSFWCACWWSVSIFASKYDFLVLLLTGQKLLQQLADHYRNYFPHGHVHTCAHVHTCKPFGNFWQTTCQRIRHEHSGNTLKWLNIYLQDIEARKLQYEGLLNIKMTLDCAICMMVEN